MPSLEATSENRPGDVLRRTWSLSAIDVATDHAGRVRTGPAVAPLLHDQRPRPRVFIITPLMVIAVTLPAVSAPARRATRVDPLSALRIEAASTRISERSAFAAASGSTRDGHDSVDWV